MRRADKEIRKESRINEMLAKARLCHIAFHDEFYPYLVTVNYGYRDHCLYFHSAAEGKKIDLISRNPYICFHIISDAKMQTGNDPCNDWSMKFKSITGYGKATILRDREEKIDGLNTLMAHYSSKGPFTFSEKSLEETVVIRIEISSMTAKGSVS